MVRNAYLATRDEAVGRPLDITIPEKLRQRHWGGIRRGNAHGPDAPQCERVTRGARSRISVEFAILPFREYAGRVIGIAAVLRYDTIRYEETKQLKTEISPLKMALDASEQSE